MAFPDSDLDIIIRAYLGANPNDHPDDWPSPTDLSDRLLRRDINITRGRRPGQKTAAAGSCVFWLDNTDGALTPTLATSQFYPDWDLGCPMTVSVDNVGTAPPYRRFGGFIADVTAVMVPGVGGQNISAVRVTLAGLIRRLTQGSVAKSALSRTLFAVNALVAPVAYWPLETGPTSLVAGASDFTIVSTPVEDQVRYGEGQFADWLPAGLTASGTLALRAQSPHGPAPTTVAVDIVRRAHGASATNNNAFASLGLFAAAESGGQNFEYYVQSAWNTGVPTLNLYREVFGSAATLIDSATDTEAKAGFDDAMHHWRLQATQDGLDVDLAVYLDGVLIMSGAHASATLRRPRVNLVQFALESSWGHVLLWLNDVRDIGEVEWAVRGYSGEEAHMRFARVCDEEGIVYLGPTSPGA